MTGQGDRKFDMIKQARTGLVKINLQKVFTTQGGEKVRALRFVGMNRYEVIKGQLLTVDADLKPIWIDCTWTVNGEIIPDEQAKITVHGNLYNLKEKEYVTPRLPKLFMLIAVVWLSSCASIKQHSYQPSYEQQARAKAK